MTITLYNSKTRRKEAFQPIDPTNVRMYVCGPTVYDRAHIGNARPAIVFDVLFRLLRHTYGAAHVTYVRNFTDVDDKINAKAAATGRSIREICDETIGWYLDDMAAVGVMQPSHMPRATEYIGQMVAMIAGLIAGGHAYAAQGHVLFRVRSYSDYGHLSGRSVDDMIAGARVEVSPFKEDPLDFVLWKPSDSGAPGWDSPWGYGRPGWHIECSAMAHDLLGDSFDIHGGGLDLQFPHHENELAQSHCAHPHGDFARVWMHNEMLQVEGKKMSKSLGNFFTVRDLLDKGVAGEVIRFVMLSTHYRKPMDWTEAKALEAERTIRRWNGYVSNAGYTTMKAGGNITIGDIPVPGLFEALSDDLNTSRALTSLLTFEKEKLAGNTPNIHQVGQFLASLSLLGFTGGVNATVRFPHHRDWLSQIAKDIDHFRSCRQFEYADKIKSTLVQSGFEVQITKEGARVIETSRSDLTDLRDSYKKLIETFK
jgi:cysteinyl-tRNA synthetase